MRFMQICNQQSPSANHVSRLRVSKITSLWVPIPTCSNRKSQKSGVGTILYRHRNRSSIRPYHNRHVSRNLKQGNAKQWIEMSMSKKYWKGYYFIVCQSSIKHETFQREACIVQICGGRGGVGHTSIIPRACLVHGVVVSAACCLQVAVTVLVAVFICVTIVMCRAACSRVANWNDNFNWQCEQHLHSIFVSMCITICFKF